MSNLDAMTYQDAAEYLSVSTKTIRRWVQDGKITARYLTPRTHRLDVAGFLSDCPTNQDYRC